MKKRLFAAVGAAIITAAALAGCGASGAVSTTAAAKETKAETTAAAGEAETTRAAGELEKITVAASTTPHAEILAEAKPLLAEKGYDLEVTEFEDYVQPNMVVESGEFDANYFQHIPYLDSFNQEKETHLINAGGIHYEPFGIYPGTKKSLDDIAEGDTIAIPNDTTNMARALLLLQDNGIIKMKDGAGLTATEKDIAENPKNVKIQPLEAAQVARVVNECAFVVLNGNYAMEAGFTVSKDAIAYEKSDSEAAKTYVNIIAVKEGNESSDKIKALVETLTSDKITEFINKNYNGAVIPFKN
ncbi:MetQ/NlpA family ABC transporter substrate-binding protein [[Clostridium] aminophilum]|uniref:MetQ/NlpA family ABC transporter substrate-binding protein n=1 Tax=[Clostridium] aminophilum TaxID=1526 RepID=UPI003F977A0A